MNNFLILTLFLGLGVISASASIYTSHDASNEISFMEMNENMNAKRAIKQRTATIYVRSYGCNKYIRWRHWWGWRHYCGKGDIYVNGRRRIHWQGYRGLSGIAMEPINGRVVSVRAFDTGYHRWAGYYLYRWVNAYKKDYIFTLAARGYWTRWLGSYGKRILYSLGLSKSTRLYSNGAFILIGSRSGKQGYSIAKAGTGNTILSKSATVALPPIIYCQIYQKMCKYHPQHRGHFFDRYRRTRVKSAKECVARAKWYHTALCGNPENVPTTVWPWVNGVKQHQERTTYPKGSCLITTPYASRFRSSTKYQRTSDTWGEIYRGSGLNEKVCLNRAKEYHRWFRNPWTEKGWVTAEFPKTDGKMVFPGLGCWMSTPNCRKYPTSRYKGYFRDFTGERWKDTGFLEASCFSRAREYFQMCGNTDEEPVTAYFLTSKQSNTYPAPIPDTTDYKGLIQTAKEAAEHQAYKDAQDAEKDARELHTQIWIDHRAIEKAALEGARLSDNAEEKQILSQRAKLVEDVSKDVEKTFQKMQKDANDRDLLITTKTTQVKNDESIHNAKKEAEISIHEQKLKARTAQAIETVKKLEETHASAQSDLFNIMEKAQNAVSEDIKHTMTAAAKDVRTFQNDARIADSQFKADAEKEATILKQRQTIATTEAKRVNAHHRAIVDSREKQLTTAERENALRNAKEQMKFIHDKEREDLTYANAVGAIEIRREKFLKEEQDKDQERRKKFLDDEQSAYTKHKVFREAHEKALDQIFDSSIKDAIADVDNQKHEQIQADIVDTNAWLRASLDHAKQHKIMQEALEKPGDLAARTVKGLTECARECASCPCKQQGARAFNEEGQRLAYLHEKDVFPGILEKSQNVAAIPIYNHPSKLKTSDEESEVSS